MQQYPATFKCAICHWESKNVFLFKTFRVYQKPNIFICLSCDSDHNNTELIWSIIMDNHNAEKAAKEQAEDVTN